MPVSDERACGPEQRCWQDWDRGAMKRHQWLLGYSDTLCGF